MKRMLFLVLSVILCAASAAAGQDRFAGTETCAQCHEEEYESFMKRSDKSHSLSSVVKMADHLDDDEIVGCLDCHSGKRDNPDFTLTADDVAKAANGDSIPEGAARFANVGCEACHGPGGEHAREGSATLGDRRLISIPDRDICESCHKGIHTLEYKGVIQAGGH